MKLRNPGILKIILFALFFYCSFASGRDVISIEDSAKYISPFYEDNERCFRCHGSDKYEYTNDMLGMQVKALMCAEHIITRDVFYGSNHKSFSCTDCHSVDYDTFPHPGALRMELKYNCLDCHGGDDAYSSFNFDKIDVDYRESVHFKLEEQGFTCWRCHDPHTYRINIRDSRNLKETILYDNAICLNCHSDYKLFQLLSDRDEVNLMETHDWLPDQAAHFRSVRCIECHTKINDSILVSHLVLPKDKAVRLCNECHSRNSLLMVSLYKFQSKEQRRDGFLNGIILNESYVIGANRNSYLGTASLIIFGIVLIVIIIHILFRIKRK